MTPSPASNQGSQHALETLPAGWCWVTVEQVARVTSGQTPVGIENHVSPDGVLPWFKVGDMNSEGNSRWMRASRTRLSEATADTFGLTIFPSEAIVFPKRGGAIATNKKRLLAQPSCVDLNTMGVIFAPGLAMYGWWWFQSVNLAALSDGSNVPQLNHGDIKPLVLPLPPLAEQGRIVAKIEELFSDLDAGVTALERVRANLKRYRAAVLKAAVEGRLTEEWRTRNPATEPAAKLLERILAERRAKWEQDQLRKFKEAGKTPPKWWKEKYEEPGAVGDAAAAPLPRTWCWATTDQLGWIQLGRQRSPKNRSKDFATKYLRAANITENGLDLSDLLDMEFQPHELETYRMKAGDLVLSEASGSPEQVGKPAVWNDEIPDCCFQNTVIRLRPCGARSDFLLCVFKHFYVNKVFAKIAGGVGINHLSAAKFSRIAVPLAPLAEQAEIVAEVDRRLSVAHAAETQVEHALQRAARLRQAILKRAFEGKLVPQDPTDEPAAALVERLDTTSDRHILEAAPRPAVRAPRRKRAHA